MAKVRQDAWSHEDDLLLAETVLRHIREGGTQLNAFEEVGDELNRTSAACGFRWNAEVRNKYIHAIDLAKRQRKDRKRAQVAQARTYEQISPKIVQEPSYEQEVNYEHPVVREQTTITLDHVIQYLQSIKQDYYASNQSKRTANQYKAENDRLQEEITQLDKQLTKTEKKLTTVEDDYKMFIQIMDRARKMTVLEEQSPSNSPAFKMDKNGNLEQLI